MSTRTKTIFAAAVLFGLPTPSMIMHAQTQSITQTKRSKELRNLFDHAQGMPPEFSADILLRLAERCSADARTKRELVETAFAAGARAQLPYRQEARKVAADSRISLTVSDNGLEALTLQTRAIAIMLALDPARALELYRDIPGPKVTEGRCDEAVTTEVSTYYRAAEQLFARAFTAKQRERGEAVEFLAERVNWMRSPADVPPVLHMILSVHLTASDRQILLVRFASALGQVPADDRNFGATEPFLVPGAAPEVTDAAMFVPALRSYIKRHVSGPRCSDNAPASGQVPLVVSNFNGFVQRLRLHGLEVEPISVEESQPEKILGTFKNQFAWRSSRSKQVLATLQLINHTRPDTPEGRLLYEDAIKLIDGWEEDDVGSRDDYCFMVSSALSTLAANASSEAAAEGAMRRYIAVLEQYYPLCETRNSWFAHVQMMLRRSRNIGGTGRMWTLNLLAQSANPVLALYASVEKFLDSE